MDEVGFVFKPPIAIEIEFGLGKGNAKAFPFGWGKLGAIEFVE